MYYHIGRAIVPKILLNVYHNAWDSDIAFFLYMAQSSDPQFHVTHCVGVLLITCYNYNEVNHIVVP